jgi:hypothetical protein
MAKSNLDSKTGLVKKALFNHAIATTDACPLRVRQASRSHPAVIPQTSDCMYACHVYGSLHASYNRQHVVISISVSIIMVKRNASLSMFVISSLIVLTF